MGGDIVCSLLVLKETETKGANKWSEMTGQIGPYNFSRLHGK